MNIYQCSAVVFQSLTNPDEYILGSYKDGTLTVEIPQHINLYDADDVSIGSNLFQPQPENKYSLNIEWESITDSLKILTLENNNLYLTGFAPIIKSKWGDYDPHIGLFHRSVYPAVNYIKILNLLYSVSSSIMGQIATLPIMDLSLYLSSIHCLLLDEVSPLKLDSWYYIKDNLMTIRDNKGLALFYQDIIENFLNLCDKKIAVLQDLEILKSSLDQEKFIDFIKLK